MCCSRQDYNYRITVIVRCVSSILILDCCASKKQHSTAIIGLHPKQTPKWRLHCEEGCLWRCSWWRLAGVDRPLSSSSGWSTQEYHLTSTRRESTLTRHVIEILISDLWRWVHHSLMLDVSIDLSASRTRSPVRTGQILSIPHPLSFSISSSPVSTSNTRAPARAGWVRAKEDVSGEMRRMETSPALSRIDESSKSIHTRSLMRNRVSTGSPISTR